MAGPALGGALLATVGVAACCAVNAASYAIPLFVLLRHRPAYVTDTAGTADRRARPAVSLRDGIRYAWHHGPVRVCVGLAAASGLLFNMGVALPVLATHVFHLGGGGYWLGCRCRDRRRMTAARRRRQLHRAADSYLTSPTGPAVLAALDAISAERGVAPATVALAWLRGRPNVVAPLASARTVDQLPALLASADLDLTPGETEALDKASAA